MNIKNLKKNNKLISHENSKKFYTALSENKVCTRFFVNEQKKLPYHSQLFYLIEYNKHPDIIINFIYIKLYELINETNYLDADSYQKLFFLYSEYYNDYYKKQEKMNWFITLFPPVYDSYNYFSFKNFYVGLVSRILSFSFDPETNDCAFHWYGDPKDWSVSYHLYINTKNKIEINKCKFLVTDELNDSSLDLVSSYSLDWWEYVYILAKNFNSSPVDLDDFEYFENFQQFKKDFPSPDDFILMCRYGVEGKNELPFKGITEIAFNNMLTKYKENANRESDLCINTDKNKKTKKQLEKQYDGYKTYGYAKEIKHLGYNSDLGNLWYKYKEEENKLKLKELNKRIKKIKL